MVTAEQLEERKALIAASPDLAALLNRLVQRAQPVIARMPPVPQVKALLSREGGFCPKDGGSLIFDPWSPSEHRCGGCGGVAQGERQHRHWAKLQHLWLAERAAHLATVAALADDPAAADRSVEILQAYHTLYFELPNRDNVLGPTHLFFSTYLESIWILNYLAAATMLRESGMLPEDTGPVVDAIADEAANVIGDFNEGFSNRQTWHAAALTAIAAWFGDEELARSSIEGRTGLVGHLADGFGEDGTWYEGENYHLFALRGLLTGLGWARMLGADILDDPAVAEHLRLALLAPALTALPDLTFPARKDSRFGVSLAQPMYLELWEIGRGLVGAEDDELSAWLSALYRAKAQAAIPFESYLHEAGEPVPASRTRSDLSWWSLLGVAPDLTATSQWEPASRHLRSQGLAVLRQGDHYASLECGSPGGGHGHPDRLHLTVHAGGVHWLPDFGTGSYVSPDLFWYRSTLAHNAPLLDGASQPFLPATCEMFDVQEKWSWVRGRFKQCERTVISGPDYLLDIVTYADDVPRTMDLPWHLMGETSVESQGKWEPLAPDALDTDFVRQPERFVLGGEGPVVLRSTVEGAGCRILLQFEGNLIRGRAPGPPGTGERPFYLIRGQGPLVRTVAVIDLGGRVTGVSHEGDVIAVIHASTDRHTPLIEGWQIESGGETVRLAGVQRVAAAAEAILTRERIDRPEAAAPWIDQPPALDGSDDGFDLSEPLTLDTELQYRRSEEPYADAEYFSATAWINWGDQEIYFLVDVTKADPIFRPRSAPPLGLDNEADDIHSDGIQVYLKQGERVLGFLVVPETDSHQLRVSAAGTGGGDPAGVSGAWSLTDGGYRVTLAIRPEWTIDSREPMEFDLLVNEMRPERQRRAGQLVWSGAHGWVYLRGDRQDPSSFGLLVLGS
jgi:hypothetical protein